MNLEQLKDKLDLGEDKVYGVMGAFENPDQLVDAGRRIREMGYTKLDAMSPFPVHGIDEAIGELLVETVSPVTLEVALTNRPTRTSVPIGGSRPAASEAGGTSSV